MIIISPYLRRPFTRKILYLNPLTHTCLFCCRANWFLLTSRPRRLVPPLCNLLLLRHICFIKLSIKKEEITKTNGFHRGSKLYTKRKETYWSRVLAFSFFRMPEITAGWFVDFDCEKIHTCFTFENKGKFRKNRLSELWFDVYRVHTCFGVSRVGFLIINQELMRSMHSKFTIPDSKYNPYKVTNLVPVN